VCGVDRWLQSSQ